MTYDNIGNCSDHVILETVTGDIIVDYNDYGCDYAMPPLLITRDSDVTVRLVTGPMSMSRGFRANVTFHGNYSD